MWKFPFFRPKNWRSVARELAEATETVDRLEIRMRRLETKHAELASDHEHLCVRLNQIGGRLGGRPRVSPVRGAPAQPLSVDEVPPGDKAGLRAALQQRLQLGARAHVSQSQEE